QHLKIPNEQLPHSVLEMFNQIALKMGVDWDETNPESLLIKLPTHLQRMFSAMTKTTFTPTVLNGGKRNELFKGSYELKVDARPLPNTNKSDFQSLIKE